MDSDYGVWENMNINSESCFVSQAVDAYQKVPGSVITGYVMETWWLLLLYNSHQHTWNERDTAEQKTPILCADDPLQKGFQMDILHTNIRGGDWLWKMVSITVSLKGSSAHSKGWVDQKGDSHDI